MSYAMTTPLWTLLQYVGISLDEQGCLLDARQLLGLGKVLLRLCSPREGRPHIVGGALSSLADDHPTTVYALDDALDTHDDALLVVTGSHGMLALLALRSGDEYQARLWSDPDCVDRIVLVLTQLSDYAYQLDDLSSAATQQRLLSELAGALETEALLSEQQLEALLDAATAGPPAAVSVAPIEADDAVPTRPTSLALPMELLDQLRDGIVVVDVYGRIVAYNGVAAQLIGLTPYSIGAALVELPTMIFALLLSEALIGNVPDPHIVAFHPDHHTRIVVVEAGRDQWAFLLQPQLPQSPAAVR
jgi:PAS domain-containing protein